MQSLLAVCCPLLEGFSKGVLLLRLPMIMLCMILLCTQSKDGQYKRPSYSFQGRLGSPEFPLEPGRYHL